MEYQLSMPTDARGAPDRPCNQGVRPPGDCCHTLLYVESAKRSNGPSLTRMGGGPVVTIWLPMAGSGEPRSKEGGVRYIAWDSKLPLIACNAQDA